MLIKLILIIITMLSLKQIKFQQEPLHDFNILSGVTGSAKSFSANLKWYEAILTAPKNSRFIQSGNTEGSLYDNITKPIIDMDMGQDLDYIGVANKKRLIVRRTGTQVICAGANTENAQNRIQGKNVRGWYGDEIVKQPLSFVDMANSRCRYIENDKIVTGFRLWTCNPDHPQHPVKVNYIDNTELDVKNWYFGFYDNPTMTKKFVDNLKKTFSGVFADRMVYGKWVIAEGAIYKNFSRDNHVVDSFPMERIKEFEIWVDWGYDNPMGMLFVGITGDNQYIILDEFYERGITIDKEFPMPSGWDKIALGYGDPSRPDLLLQFNNYTGIDMYEADNDVLEGIMEVQKYFNKRDNGEYGIYVLSHCTNFLKEIDGYRWKKSREGIAKDEPVKENDHLMDCLRYGIYTRRDNMDFSNLPKVDHQEKNGV